MVKSRTGYSLVELVIVVAIVAVMAVVAVPRLSYSLVRRTKAEAGAYKLMTDLRLTRSMAIRDAATNNKGYELDMTGSAPYSGYTIQNTNTHTAVATYTFESGVSVTCPGVKNFKYQPLGNLKQDESGTQISVAASGTTYILTLDAVGDTGTVKCTKN